MNYETPDYKIGILISTSLIIDISLASVSISDNSMSSDDDASGTKYSGLK